MNELLFLFGYFLFTIGVAAGVNLDYHLISATGHLGDGSTIIFCYRAKGWVLGIIFLPKGARAWFTLAIIHLPKGSYLINFQKGGIFDSDNLSFYHLSGPHKGSSYR
jgi:hypothetical protein